MDGTPLPPSGFRSVLNGIQQSRSEASMNFHEESSHYEKTIVSDLQGAWENLRAGLVDNHPCPESERLLCLVVGLGNIRMPCRNQTRKPLQTQPRRPL